ncbi:MAG: MoaD/ThiS family protein [Pseudomonadota bacterium]
MARLHFLGRLVDVTGHPSETVDLPAALTDTSSLRQWLDDRGAQDGAFLDPTVRVAINDELVIEPAAIANSDEIAFLPPVGGG